MRQERKVLTETNCRGALIGIALGIIVQIALVLLTTILIIKGSVSSDRIKLLSTVIRTISVFIALVVTGFLTESKKLLVCTVTCLILFFTWLILAVLIFDGSIYNIFLAMLGTLVPYLGAVLLILNKYQGRRLGYTKKHYR